MMAEQQLKDALHDLLRRRNLTINGLHVRTGIDRQVLVRMENNIPPRVEIIERLAEAMGEDIRPWREAIGKPLPEMPHTRLTLGLRALNREFGRPIPVDFSKVWDDEDLTFERVDTILRDLRSQLEQGLI
jgi:transcriptional regulator with XRE-family HTH domain